MSKLFKNAPGFTRITKEYRPELIRRVLSYLEYHVNTVADLDWENFRSWENFRQGYDFRNERRNVYYSQIEANVELEFKEDYGDLDLIALCDTPQGSELLQRIKFKSADFPMVKGEFCRISNVFNNSNCTSFLFRDSDVGEPLRCYHIDITRCSSKQQYDNMVTYYRNGVINNFIGQFLRAFGVKSGHNGIYYLYKDKRGNTVEIKFEEDYRKFYIDYFDLDLNTLVFTSFEQLCTFLTTLPFFPGRARYASVNSSDKKRAMKLHSLANDLYKYLVQAGPEHSTFVMQLKPHHQEVIDAYIERYERRLDVGQANRKSLFAFLEEHNVPSTYFKTVFSTMMPILNSVKGVENDD